MLLLIVAAMAATYAQAALDPLQESMRLALGLTDNEVALLQGPALAVPMALASIPLGTLIDRYSRVRLLFVLAVCDAAGSVLTAFARDFVALFSARCLVGLASLASVPAAFSLIADLYAPEERGRACMGVQIGQCVGLTGAFALGSLLLHVLGADFGNWRRAMYGLSVPLVFIAFAVLLMQEPTRTDIAVVDRRRRSWNDIFRHRATIGPMILGVALGQMALFAIYSWGAPMLAREFLLPPEIIGWIMACGLLLSGIVGAIGGGVIADRSQRTGGPRGTSLLLGRLSLLVAPTGLFAFVPESFSASALLVLFLIAVTALSVMGSTLFIVVVPSELRGLCVAVLTAACVLVGVGLGPLSVSLISDFLGGAAMIGKALSVVCAMTSVLSAAAFRAGSRYLPPRESEIVAAPA